nr:FAD-dependent oxidoreductase [Mycobacteroides abscessus]
MTTSAPRPDYYDVVIIGAGISGIGAAAYLTREFPKKKVVLLEGRGALGVTPRQVVNGVVSGSR